MKHKQQGLYVEYLFCLYFFNCLKFQCSLVQICMYCFLTVYNVRRSMRSSVFVLNWLTSVKNRDDNKYFPFFLLNTLRVFWQINGCKNVPVSILATAYLFRFRICLWILKETLITMSKRKLPETNLSKLQSWIMFDEDSITTFANWFIRTAFTHNSSVLIYMFNTYILINEAY